MDILKNLEKANSLSMRVLHMPRSKQNGVAITAIYALIEGVKEAVSKKDYSEYFRKLDEECAKALYTLDRISAYGINEEDMWYVEGLTYRAMGIASMLRLAELL